MLKISCFALASVLLLTSTSFSQETPPTLAEIQARVKESNLKLTSGSFEILKIRTTDDNFLPEQPGFVRINKPLIGGKEVSIFQEACRFAPGRRANATNLCVITPDRVVSTRSTTWLDTATNTQSTLFEHSEGMDQNGQAFVEGGGETYVRVSKRRFSSSLPELLVGPEAMTIGDNCVVTGKTTYKGVECIELEQTSPENNFQRRVLVCPSCDYRIVLMESHSTYTNEGQPLEVVQTTSVEKMTKFGEMWIPSQIRQESNRIQGTNLPLAQISKTRVISFRLNISPADMAFEPLIVPGTFILNEFDKSYRPSGADIRGFIKQFRAGDFSALGADENDQLIAAK